MTDPPTGIVTIADAVRAAAAHLRAANIEQPRLDGEVLLRHLLGWDRTTLFLRLPDAIPATLIPAYWAIIEERARRVPVAYLTGSRAFLNLTLAVTPAVLIPRPETELLVEWAAGWLAQRRRPRPVVVDIGTGSGAIALGLASLLPLSWPGAMIAADVSEAALAVAIANRNALQRDGVPTDKVSMVRGSLLSWCGGPVDLVLANLPYLRPEQVDDNPDLRPEPRLALDGGWDGLDLIRDLIRDLPRVLHPSAAVALELDPSQAGAVATLLRETLPDAQIDSHTDLAGRDRFVTAIGQPAPGE